MDSDEVSQIHESMVDDWFRRLGKYNTHGIEKLASKYRNDDKYICVKMNNGSFNWCFNEPTSWVCALQGISHTNENPNFSKLEVLILRSVI
jgi:hypothetical protein